LLSTVSAETPGVRHRDAMHPGFGGFMRALIVFATTDGHTEVLARFVAERLGRAGLSGSLCNAEDAKLPDPSRFDAAILAASIQDGRYQGSICRFARRNHSTLNAMPSAFISVSLSAASHSSEDHDRLDDWLDRFERQTHWRPKAVHHVGGVLPLSRENIFRKLLLKIRAAEDGFTLDTSEDYDLTDYDALCAFIDGFIAAASGAGVDQEVAEPAQP
jgi:menaquinone-dependent protoporphyrinogen oxidase